MSRDDLILGRRQRKSTHEESEASQTRLSISSETSPKNSSRRASRAPNLAVPSLETQHAHASESEDPDPATISVVVEGNRITINPDAIRTHSGDPGVIVWWADVLSRAEREHAQCDATYRHNRATGMQAFLASDPKAPEWKVRAAIESTAWFVEAQRILAETTRACTLLRAVVDALQ